MPLHKIDIDELEEQCKKGMISPSSKSGYVFSKIVTSINRSRLLHNAKLSSKYTSSILINISLLEYFEDSSSYITSAIGAISDDPGTIIPVGMLMGHNVYLTPDLKDDEYFLGDDKDLIVFKRKDKITKILQR